MNLRTVAIAMVFAISKLSALQDPAQHHLMPVPANISFGQGRLMVDSSMNVAQAGFSDDRLRAGIGRALTRVEGRTGLTISKKLDGDPSSAKLVVNCKGAGKDIPAVDEDESYTLDVTPQQAILKSNTVVGTLRGLETFLQLLTADHDGYWLPVINIQDAPRFAWRGLLIDVGRHFQPMEVLKRNLDAMAAVKMNVLHWHLTEDQGFRIESLKYPKLQQMGSDGQFYTQDQAREIVAYARDRGIRVVPEFDMPGHVQSWLVGYPELAAAPGPHEISRRWGIMDATFDPTNEQVYELVDGFIAEMAAIFPDAYLHIGGDENNGKWWSANANIQEFRQQKGLKDNHALQTYFNQRLQTILQKHGKRMVGWDEILHPDLPHDVVVQSWRSTKALAKTAAQGYDAILSAPYYIDRMQPASEHYQDVIAPDSDLTDEQRKHILGGEATMWSELVSPETIDSRIWPRTAAIAEKLWSPAAVNDVEDMYRRLEVVNLELEELGLTHRKNVDMMLRRMTGNDEIATLKQFLVTVHPVRIYQRHRQQKVNAYTPLTHLVDVASADSEEARKFSKDVDAFLNDAPRFRASSKELKAAFILWKALGASVQPVLTASPVLQEVAPLARDLIDMSAIGLEALESLQKRTVPSKSWQKKNQELLLIIAEPKGAIESSLYPSVRKLVYSAMALPTLKKSGVSAWQEQVKTLSAPAAKK